MTNDNVIIFEELKRRRSIKDLEDTPLSAEAVAALDDFMMQLGTKVRNTIANVQTRDPSIYLTCSDADQKMILDALVEYVLPSISARVVEDLETLRVQLKQVAAQL